MADTKITALTLFTPVGTDVIPVVDLGTTITKKATIASLPVSTATQTALDGKANTLGADDNYVTDAEKTKLTNLSGTNSGDNAANTTYASDYRVANFVAGTDYARPFVHVSTSSGATTTAADTVAINVFGAVFTYVQNAIYRIWVMGRLNSTAATTGVAIHFDVSTAITDINVIGINPLATAGTLTSFYSIADDSSAGASSGVPAGPLDVPVWMEAIFRPGNNTGTCQLRIRSETTAVTELMAGATMVVERLS